MINEQRILEVKTLHIVHDKEKRLVLYIQEELSSEELRAFVNEFREANKEKLGIIYLANEFEDFLKEKGLTAKFLVLGATIDLHKK